MKWSHTKPHSNLELISSDNQPKGVIRDLSVIIVRRFFGIWPRDNRYFIPQTRTQERNLLQRRTFVSAFEINEKRFCYPEPTTCDNIKF